MFVRDNAYLIVVADSGLVSCVTATMIVCVFLPCFARFFIRAVVSFCRGVKVVVFCSLPV